jgi:hypothetical protein
MRSSKTEGPATKRLPYEKPALRSTSLVADQVLGVGCKRITNSSDAAGSLPLPCLTKGCMVQSGS